MPFFGLVRTPWRRGRRVAASRSAVQSARVAGRRGATVRGGPAVRSKLYDPRFARKMAYFDPSRIHDLQLGRDSAYLDIMANLHDPVVAFQYVGLVPPQNPIGPTDSIHTLDVVCQ